MIDLIPTFIVFFAVIDPVGSVPVFIAVTRGFEDKAKKKIALVAFLASAAILLFFVAAGELILTAMSIPLAAFQIAGGIVLFLFALSMIFGESKPDEEVRLAEDSGETAIFPLAVPSIAGPGAMLTAVLMTENSQYSIVEQAQTFGVIFVVLFIAYIAMLGSRFIDRIIGKTGASVVSRVMGLIITSVGVSNILEGLRAYFSF